MKVTKRMSWVLIGSVAGAAVLTTVGLAATAPGMWGMATGTTGGGMMGAGMMNGGMMQHHTMTAEQCQVMMASGPMSAEQCQAMMNSSCP